MSVLPVLVASSSVLVAAVTAEVETGVASTVAVAVAVAVAVGEELEAGVAIAVGVEVALLSVVVSVAETEVSSEPPDSIVSPEYSIWKTGLLTSVKAAYVSHSSYSAHCSLTDHCILSITEPIISPPFFNPIDMPRECDSDARKVKKSIESASVNPRPFSFPYASILSGSTPSQPFCFAISSRELMIARTLLDLMFSHRSPGHSSRLLPKSAVSNLLMSGRQSSYVPAEK